MLLSAAGWAATRRRGIAGVLRRDRPWLRSLERRAYAERVNQVGRHRVNGPPVAPRVSSMQSQRIHATRRNNDPPLGGHRCLPPGAPIQRHVPTIHVCDLCGERIDENARYKVHLGPIGIGEDTRRRNDQFTFHGEIGADDKSCYAVFLDALEEALRSASSQRRSRRGHTGRASTRRCARAARRGRLRPASSASGSSSRRWELNVSPSARSPTG